MVVDCYPLPTNPFGVTLVPRYREARNQSPGSGKRHLLHLARPQDRSGSPTKGAKRSGGNLPDCRLSAPSPLTNSAEPLRGDARWDARLLEGRFAVAIAKRSASRSWGATAVLGSGQVEQVAWKPPLGRAGEPPTTTHLTIDSPGRCSKSPLG
ncbi:MAG: hypothetical protein ACHBN1_37130 [Heteroscytonema crispum UTEX LB 1556]